MKSEYDFSKAIKNPYAKQLKETVVLHIDDDNMAYFQDLSHQMGVSYEVLINSFLRECAKQKRKPSIAWS